MKRWLGVAAVTGVLAAGWAFALAEHGEAAPPGEAHGAAAGEHGGGHGDVKTEVSEYILHHVSDSEEFELDFPWGGHVTFHVAEWFPFLKFEREEGACGKPVPASMANFPGLSTWMDGCWDLRPTKAVFSMWIASALLFVVLLFGRKRDQNGVPRGVMTHLVEVLALFVRNEIVIPNIGKKDAHRYTTYLTSLFFFVLFTNWLGLIPGFFTGTGVITVTAALAILTFCLTQVAGIRAAGMGGYLKHLTGGVPVFLWPIMVPVEVLGLFTKPFALLVRLFANMLGGHMVVFFLLSLIFVWHVGAAAVSVPLTVAIYVLEIFVGILQAYLFTLLSSLFIGQGVALGHHGHGDDHGHGEHAH